MAKVRLAVVDGVAAFYPFGQQGESKALKEGQDVHFEVGPTAGDKERAGLLHTKMAEDMGAPAAGVDRDSPVGDREGTIEITAVDGSVTVRTYAGADFTEQVLAESDRYEVDVTESNAITLALYPAKATPK